MGIRFFFLTLIILLFVPFSCFGDEGVNVKAVGDIMMGTKYPQSILPPDDGRTLFDAVIESLAGADLLLGNLEGVFSMESQSYKDIGSGKYYAFNMPIYYAPYLKNAGFDILNIANNHSRDFGEPGLSDTIFTLQLNDILYTGLRDTMTVVRRNGFIIGVMGFYWNDYFNSILDLPDARKKISENKTKVDILIVTFHGGSEGTKASRTLDQMEYMGNTPRGNVIGFAHCAVEAGADLVIGHGPHLPRAMELYKDRLIAYSLGNFCTFGSFSMKGALKYSLVLDVDLGSDGSFLSGRVIPVILRDGGIPYPDENERSSIKMIRDLMESDFPDSSLGLSESGILNKRN